MLGQIFGPLGGPEFRPGGRGSGAQPLLLIPLGQGRPARPALGKEGPVVLQYVGAGADADGLAPGQQPVGAGAGFGVDVGGDGVDVPALFQGQPGHSQGAAALGRFHTEGAHCQAGQQPVAPGKMLRQMGCARGVFTDQGAAGGHILQQPPVVPGVVVGHIYPAGQHADQRASGLQGAVDGVAVAALHDASEHQTAQPGDLKGQFRRRFPAVWGGLPGARHGDGDLLVKPGQGAPEIEYQGRQVNIPQPLGIIAVLPGENADVVGVTAGQNLVRLGQGLV